MLSVIIATQDSERALVPTLAALVPGATSGIVSEVLLADGGSRDDTAAVADVAGCEFMLIEGGLGHRLRAAAATARAPWLMFLRPGMVPDTPWTAEVGRFIQEPARATQAGVFRRGGPSSASLREILSLVTAALGALPRPDQGWSFPSNFTSCWTAIPSRPPIRNARYCAESAGAAASCFRPQCSARSRTGRTDT